MLALVLSLAQGAEEGPFRLEHPACAAMRKGRYWHPARLCELSGDYGTYSVGGDKLAPDGVRYVFADQLVQTGPGSFALGALPGGSKLANVNLEIRAVIDLTGVCQDELDDGLYVTPFEALGENVTIDSVQVSGTIRIINAPPNLQLHLYTLGSYTGMTVTNSGSSLQYFVDDKEVNGIAVPANLNASEF